MILICEPEPTRKDTNCDWFGLSSPKQSEPLAYGSNPAAPLSEVDSCSTTKPCGDSILVACAQMDQRQNANLRMKNLALELDSCDENN